jgi:prepilin-type N-terminal cleavage/methylation domain-containing protein
MKPLIRAKGRGGFTLVELLVVAAIITLLLLAAGAAISNEMEKNAKCVKFRTEMVDTAERCINTINSNGTTDAIASCIADGQKLLDEVCANCGKLPTGVATAIKTANASISEYRGKLTVQADKDKIKDFKSPC